MSNGNAFTETSWQLTVNSIKNLFDVTLPKELFTFKTPSDEPLIVKQVSDEH